jgi:hypothetical protein
MTWRQFWCGIRTGHEEVPVFESRFRMRCVTCLHESPGIAIGGRPPRLQYEGDPRRHALARPRLVIRRRA